MQLLLMTQLQRPSGVADIVLQEWGPHSHPHLIPTVAFFIDGLDRTGSPASQVAVEGTQEGWHAGTEE